MRRLIDVNELYVDARCGENEEPYISLYQINDAPTVDAVYVVVNGIDTKVFTNAEDAKAEVAEINYHREMSGAHEGFAYIVKTEVL